jgi:hypothetical protein
MQYVARTNEKGGGGEGTGKKGGKEIKVQNE